MFRLLSLFFIVMILSCGRGMHEEGDSDVDEFEDERAEAMEQAILDFIREIPKSSLLLTKKMKIYVQQLKKDNHERQQNDKLVKDHRR